MQRHFTLSIIMLTAATLTGCASSGKTYPSLEIRDAERISGAFEADSAVTAPEPLPAATLAQLPQLEAGAAAAHRAFQSAVPAASRTVQNGRGAATASDNWATSQVALGELDSLRSQAAVYLGDVDLLFVDATLAFEQREAIARTRDKIILMIEEEDRVLAQLRGILGN